MPRQIATIPMAGTRKTGRPRRRWSDKVKWDLKHNWIKNRQAMARDRQE